MAQGAHRTTKKRRSRVDERFHDGLIVERKNGDHTLDDSADEETLARINIPSASPQTTLRKNNAPPKWLVQINTEWGFLAPPDAFFPDRFPAIRAAKGNQGVC